jgi:hypothetical protein
MFFTPLLQGGALLNKYTSIIPQIDVISNSSVLASGTLSWTHTPTQKPSAVVVFTHNQDFFTTSVTYGGVALTLIKSRSGSDSGLASQTGYCWSSNTALPAGPQTIIVSYTGAAGGSWGHAIAYTLFNSSTTSPVRSATSNLASSSVNAGQIYLDVPAGDLGICGAGFLNTSGAAINPTDGKIKDLQLGVGTSSQSAYIHAAGPQSSFSVARSFGTGQDFAMIAASIQPAESVLATRLSNTGTYFVNGYMDEVSKKISSVDSSSILYSSEFDEVTFASNPNFARRIANTGNTYITGSFDEYTKVS